MEQNTLVNCKQVIVLRKDLGMRKGKMVSQGAHASLIKNMNLPIENPRPFSRL